MSLESFEHPPPLGRRVVGCRSRAPISGAEGRLHRVVDERLFESEYGDPHSRDVLGVDNDHRVTIEFTDDAGCTRVSVVQDANISAPARAHAEGGWRLALNNLKGLVERATTLRMSRDPAPPVVAVQLPDRGPIEEDASTPSSAIRLRPSPGSVVVAAPDHRPPANSLPTRSRDASSPAAVHRPSVATRARHRSP